MLSISKGNSDYKVKKVKFKGFTREQLLQGGKEIYAKRGEAPPFFLLRRRPRHRRRPKTGKQKEAELLMWT